jgi:hypothetical protein
LGSNAADPVDIGYADGYRKVLAWVDGVPYIGAGCRWFTLVEAHAHWDGRANRAMTSALLKAADALVALRAAT